MAEYRQSTHKRKFEQTIDWTLVFCYVLLVFIGWLNIYASIHSTEGGSILNLAGRSGKQLIWIISSLGLGAVIMFVISPRLWEVISTPAYAVVLGLLVAVIMFGVEVKGSRSWFAFGPVSFQPAEISKITTSLFLAMIMSKSGFRLDNMSNFLKVGLALGIPMLIILAESETGSMLVYVGFLLVLYREGMSGWILAFIGLIIILFILALTVSPWLSTGILLAGAVMFAVYSINRTRKKTPERRFLLLATIIGTIAGIALIISTDFVFNNVLQDHQRKRIEVLLGMKEDPSGVGYNVHQSMIAIGSGGFFGKGYLNGTQTTYGFVPEQSTDFIFCTIGEEWGFVGCFFVIAIYLLLIFRLIYDAEKCRESFTRIYGYCVASCISMHLFINIGMTIGLMPVIGIPLPLLSYGGSSLWAFTILIFIFIALDREENKYF